MTRFEDFELAIKGFSLTPKERMVSYLIYANGGSNDYVAVQADMSLNTLKTHLRHIYKKMGVGTRHQMNILIRERIEENTRIRTG